MCWNRWRAAASISHLVESIQCKRLRFDLLVVFWLHVVLYVYLRLLFVDPAECRSTAWTTMCLTAVPLIGSKPEPLVISSTQFSTALVTGVPHFFNNAMLSHSSQSELANLENYTTEHSTRQTHTLLQGPYDNSMRKKTALHSLTWLFHGNLLPTGLTSKDLIHIMVSHSRSRITIKKVLSLSRDVNRWSVKTECNEYGREICPMVWDYAGQ